MSNQPNNQPEKKPATPDHEQRQRDGKRGVLWSIQVSFYDGDHNQEIKHRVIRNLYWHEIERFRYDCFAIGFIIHMDPGHIKLVNPADINKVDFFRQKGYFSDY